MPIRHVQIVNPQGLHMRPAAEFVKTANRYLCTVTVRVGDKEANGKSVMDVLELAGDALCGAILRIEAEGEDAEACLDALAEVAKLRYDEP